MKNGRHWLADLRACLRAVWGTNAEMEVGAMPKHDGIEQQLRALDGSPVEAASLKIDRLSAAADSLSHATARPARTLDEALKQIARGG